MDEELQAAKAIFKKIGPEILDSIFGAVEKTEDVRKSAVAMIVAQQIVASVFRNTTVEEHYEPIMNYFALGVLTILDEGTNVPIDIMDCEGSA